MDHRVVPRVLACSSGTLRPLAVAFRTSPPSPFRRAVSRVGAARRGLGVSGGRRRVSNVLAALVALASCPPPLWAARFDAASVIPCREVTGDEFSAANPNERLVEARFQITALPDDDDPVERMQYTYRLINPSGSMRIVDYVPRTSQSTSLAGPVSVETKRETNQSLGVSVSGGFESWVRGTAGSDLGAKNASQIRYELKPPMDVSLLAGTIQRGTGVYFKLFPSADTPWEGSREFVAVLRVGADWRGDVMYVACEAHEDRRGRLIARGGARFVVGLYAEGDDEARDRAEQLAMAEAALRRGAARNRREIERRAVPTVLHQVGAMLDVYQPLIPDAWLDRLIHGPTRLDEHDFVDHLPGEVRRLAEQHAYAKERLYEFSRTSLCAGVQHWVRASTTRSPTSEVP